MLTAPAALLTIRSFSLCPLCLCGKKFLKFVFTEHSNYNSQPLIPRILLTMIRHLSFSLAISFTLLTLASCATVKEQTNIEPAGWAAEKQTREQIISWEIRGRLGVQTENDGGTLDIIWKQAEQDFSIRLIAPLGAGNYLVQGNGDGAEIRFPDGRIKTVDNIDHVFSSILEVNLPAGAVKDWIRGLPAKTMSIENISWNEQGLLNTVKQSGWNVEMKKYTGKKVSLPHVIYLSRNDDAELDIRLVLRQWLIDN
ncbi:MAG: outer membrane lipoprotein LolB [Gammaproteobacteria bacterium]|nr:MAG: outer membrane lipoprotein LolB [Gammaproteobacteria bacterium]